MWGLHERGKMASDGEAEPGISEERTLELKPEVGAGASRAV